MGANWHVTHTPISPFCVPTLMKKKLFYIILICLFAGSGWAYTETFYVREDGTGGSPETSCATAGSWDMDDLDNGANWDTDDQDDGKLGLNDQVIICDDGGTFRPSGQTNHLDTHADGTSGNPITITGESGGSPVISGADLLTSWTQHEGANLLTDGGLENWNDATDLTSWTESIAGGSTLNRDADQQAGTYAVRCDVAADNGTCEYEQEISLAASTQYNIRLYYKEDGDESAEGTNVEVQEEFSNNTKVYDVETCCTASYTLIDDTFTTDEAGNYSIKIKKWYTDDGYALYTDTVSVTLDTTNVWYNTDLTADPNVVWLDDVSYPEAASCAVVNATNRWYWDAGTPQLCVYGTSDPSSFYSSSGVQAPVFLNAFYIDDDWIVVEDLTFTYAEQTTFALSGGDNNVIDNITVTGAGDKSAFKIIGDANNNTVKNSTFSANNLTVDDTDTFVINESAVDSGNKPTGNIIQNNTIQNGGHTIFNLMEADDNIIEYNDITNPNSSYGRCVEIKGEADTGGNIFRYNLVHGCYGEEAGHDRSKGKNQINGAGNIIHHNIFYGDQSNYTIGVLDWDEGNWNWVANGLLFYNNVIYGGDEAAIKYDTLDEAGSSGNVFKNNIIVANGGAGNLQVLLDNDSSAKVTFEYNLIWDTDTASTIDDGSARTVAYMETNYATYWLNNITPADPLFTNPGSGDFTLQFKSPAIDAGIGIAGYGTKLLPGSSWPSSVITGPVGNNVDIGAYEYPVWGE